MVLDFNKILNLFSFSENDPLLFNNATFLLLFALFFTVYAFIYRNRSLRTVYILIFSLFFYYKSSGWYLLILLFSVFQDYYFAIWLEDISHKSKRKALLIFSITVNLGLLAYFKYTNFFILNFNALTGKEFQLFDLVLPIGISFYTFQTISYIIDVYQGKIKASRSMLDYAFYMTFFPHLVAGPIVRARDFLPQVREDIKIDNDNLNHGIYLIFKGLIKKAVIADFVAQYADLVFPNPGAYSGFENLMAVYAYTLQIYCDFSGYSDMAIGLAALMGYKLCDNFNSPYTSTSISEFWRKWHISLSSWLRDYLYIPLGGNRSGIIRQNINLIITMLLGGLWHGANWKFVAWGGLHGLSLMVNHTFNKMTGKLNLGRFWLFNALGWALTFHTVALLWVFFRAPDFDKAMELFGRLQYADPVNWFMPFYGANSTLFWIMSIGYMFVFFSESIKAEIKSLFAKTDLVTKGVTFIIIIQLIIEFKSKGVQPFIYFQF